ncbi:MAG: helix-turn-helix domain-containing protein [Bacillota bacterium]|jgi:AraC-like DNA-binding protein
MKYFNVSPDGGLIPSQPGIAYNKSYYVEKIRECNPITKTDAVFYQFKLDEKSSSSIKIVPDACMDILFYCDPKNPRATFYGKRLESKTIELEPGYDYFGFRPYSERGIKSLNKTIIDLCNCEAPLQEVIKDNDIVEKIYCGKSFDERIDIFEEFARKHIIQEEKIIDFTNYIYRAICISRGNISMEDIIDYTGYSERYIRKKFKQFYGIAPKHFSRIIRFQNSLQKMLDKDNNELLDVVYESGFYDQAHFTREFKSFASATPSQYKENLIKKTV